MKFTALKIVLANIMLVLLTSAYSQHNNKELVSVNLSIVGKGKPFVCQNIDASEYYFVTVNVLNIQDTTVRFWVMDDCWPIESFFIKNDSIMFQSCFNGCEHSVPIEVIMPAKKSAQFYATVKSYKKEASTPLIKVGFRYFARVDDLWNYGIENPKLSKIKIFWSNEVELKDNLYSYEVK